MVSRILLLASLVLSACVCNAQVTATAETRYQLTGIDGWHIVEDAVFAPKDSKPRLVPVGWLTVDSEAAIVRVKAEDQQRRRLAVKQFTTREFAILGSGKIWIDVTAVDFEKQIFEQESFTIDVGEAPEPEPEPDPDNPDPPGPSPDVPADQFGNLGQRIDAAADVANLQHDKRLAVAEAYQSVADDMAAVPPRILRASDARDRMNALLSAIERGPEWAATIQVVSTDAATRTNLSWEQIVAWYTAVATGYRGGAR